MQSLYDQIQEAVTYIHTQTSFAPRYGIILGTGLGGLVDEIETETIISYKDIPHFPISTVQSHKSQLIVGQLAGQPIVAMAGRFNYY